MLSILSNKSSSIYNNLRGYHFYYIIIIAIIPNSTDEETVTQTGILCLPEVSQLVSGKARICTKETISRTHFLSHNTTSVTKHLSRN